MIHIVICFFFTILAIAKQKEAQQQFDDKNTRTKVNRTYEHIISSSKLIRIWKVWSKKCSPFLFMAKFHCRFTWEIAELHNVLENWLLRSMIWLLSAVSICKRAFFFSPDSYVSHAFQKPLQWSAERKKRADRNHGEIEGEREKESDKKFEAVRSTSVDANKSEKRELRFADNMLPELYGIVGKLRNWIEPRAAWWARSDAIAQLRSPLANHPLTN